MKTADSTADISLLFFSKCSFFLLLLFFFQLGTAVPLFWTACIRDPFVSAAQSACEFILIRTQVSTPASDDMYRVAMISYHIHMTCCQLTIAYPAILELKLMRAFPQLSISLKLCSLKPHLQHNYSNLHFKLNPSRTANPITTYSIRLISPSLVKLPLKSINLHRKSIEKIMLH
jgi:hypothetical protein